MVNILDTRSLHKCSVSHNPINQANVVNLKDGDKGYGS